MLYELWQLFFMLVFSAKKFQATYGPRCVQDRVSHFLSFLRASDTKLVLIDYCARMCKDIWNM